MWILAVICICQAINNTTVCPWHFLKDRKLLITTAWLGRQNAYLFRNRKSSLTSLEKFRREATSSFDLCRLSYPVSNSIIFAGNHYLQSTHNTRYIIICKLQVVSCKLVLLLHCELRVVSWFSIISIQSILLSQF